MRMLTKSRINNGHSRHINNIHLPQFEQCVTGPTREGNTLDKFLCNIKNSYKSSPLPNLGRSDHTMTYLLPIYKTKLKSFPTKKCTFKVWDDNSCEMLCGCFECNDWDIFFTIVLHL